MQATEHYIARPNKHLTLAVIMTQSEFSRVARDNRRHAVKQMFGLSSAFGMFMAVVAIIALAVAIGLVVWFLMVC